MQSRQVSNFKINKMTKAQYSGIVPSQTEVYITTDEADAVLSVNGILPNAQGNVTLSIPSAVTESTVAGWGFTKNEGTVTSVNGNQPDSSGNVAITIPDVSNLANTTLSNLSTTASPNFDGQWVPVTETPLSNGTISPDTNYTYTLSFLPDDGSIYEVIGYIEGRTLTTSGNYFAFFGNSSLMANGLLRAITRTSAYNAAMGSFNFIIGSDRQFRFKDTGSGATNVTLAFRAYRRIGTNA